ncbi:MAG: cobalamin biosynthesis protein [Nocardioidaceae bacterium]|nr:cobalamin biosynthesis protein [Nocardioidaceae bacterium]
MGPLRWAGLLLGFAADRLLGDPRRFHPVAGFGRAAGRLETSLYDDSRLRGVAFTAVLVGGATVTGLAAERATRTRPLAHTLLTATATWAVLGGRSLEREATAVGDLLGTDLPAARQRLTHLVGRATAHLDETEVARAVVESVAENTSDAVVAPLVLGGLLGIPGLLGYRAANTLDAMVGHRSERYRSFGWASARLDDLLNLPGARVAASLATLLGEDRTGALRAWRRDAARHPSPNAGPVEAAFAGALGIRLGGANTYGADVEHRPVLGDGAAPRPADIARANDLARRAGRGALVVSLLLSRAPRRQRRRAARRR